MKLLKYHFIEGLEDAQAMADIFHKDGESTLEATYRGQAEAYRLCLKYYEVVEEDLSKFIEDMEIIKDFYKEMYFTGEDSMDYYKRYYAGLYMELYLILDEIK